MNSKEAPSGAVACMRITLLSSSGESSVCKLFPIKNINPNETKSTTNASHLFCIKASNEFLYALLSATKNGSVLS